MIVMEIQGEIVYPSRGLSILCCSLMTALPRPDVPGQRHTDGQGNCLDNVAFKSVTLSEAKGLVRAGLRCFAPLSMTRELVGLLSLLSLRAKRSNLRAS